MTKKINYSVILDGTVVGTRKSHRDYTHAVVTQDKRAEGASVYCYCGRLDLAEDQKRAILRPYYWSSATIRTRGKKVARDVSNIIVTIVPLTIDNPNK